MRASRWFLAAVALTSVFGCGGSGDHRVAMPTSNVGPFTTRGNVTGTPITISSTAVQATAVTGVFSDINLHDDNANSADKQPLYYITAYIGLSTANPDGSGERLIVPGTTIDNLVINGTGTRIYYRKDNNIYYVPTKGGTPQLFLSGVTSFALSPSNRTMVYSKYNGVAYRLYSANLDKSNELLLDANIFPSLMAYMDETMIAFNRADGMYRVNVDGSNNFLIYDTIVPRYNMRTSPDGRCIAWTELSNALSRRIAKFAPIRPGVGITAPQTVDLSRDVNCVSFSPDSRYLLLTTPNGIYRSPVGFPASYSYVTGGSNVINYYESIYGRSPIDRTLVGSAGAFGPQLSAFIYGLQVTPATTVASFVGFDALTPGSIVVTAGDNEVGQPLLNFTVECDQFLKLSYSTGLGWDVVSAIKTGSNANGALVSLNGTTGAVASVVTYHGSRGARPTVIRRGGKIIIDGDLLQTFDANGKDHGPASHLELAY